MVRLVESSVKFFPYTSCTVANHLQFLKYFLHTVQDGTTCVTGLSPESINSGR